MADYDNDNTRYAIHMETGVIIPMTSETQNNYLYQEIEAKIAHMVDRGELDAKYVIEQIEKQLPKQSLREKLKLVAKLNVRQADFGLKEAALAAVEIGESKVIKIDLPKNEKPAKKEKPEPEEKTAPDGPSTGKSHAEGKEQSKPKINV